MGGGTCWNETTDTTMAQFIYSTIIQQIKNSDTIPGETDLFTEINSSLHSSFVVKDTESKKNISDAIQKSGAGLRGNLSQFLSTPLKSDKDEIDKAIKDTFENMVYQMGYSLNYSTVVPTFYKIIDPQSVPLHRQLVGVIRRILKNGKTMLVDAGVTTGKNGGALYYGTFVADDLTLLPEVRSEFESILREKTDNSYIIIADSIASIVSSAPADTKRCKYMIVMNFTSDDNAASRLESRIGVIADQFGVKNSTMIKRSFTAGFSSLFQLQFAVDIDAHALGSVIMALVDDDPELEDIVTTSGSLLVLEKIAKKK